MHQATQEFHGSHCQNDEQVNSSSSGSLGFPELPVCCTKGEADECERGGSHESYMLTELPTACVCTWLLTDSSAVRLTLSPFS